MSEKLKLSQIFKKTKQIEPSSELVGLILKRLEKEKDKQIKRDLFLSYTGLALSFSAGIYVLITFSKTFLQSEFWNMASLLFSDLSIVAGYWKEYAYSLLETFPFMHMIAILIPVFILMLSFNLYSSLKKEMHSRHWNFLGYAK
jgi:hypothetical protein